MKIDDETKENIQDIIALFLYLIGLGIMLYKPNYPSLQIGGVIASIGFLLLSPPFRRKKRVIKNGR